MCERILKEVMPYQFLNTKGEVLGLGLCAYSSGEASSIMGHQTSEIEEILGYAGRGVIVHRDNIAF